MNDQHAGFFAQLQSSECRIHTRKFRRLCRIEKGDATSKDLDLLLEISGSMGIMSGTTICGLADGKNWAVRTIVNKYREEFVARVRPVSMAVSVTVGAG